ncbi:hypothetical protein BH09BAC3_BH09BAC3_20280 [soil metagenome]
MNKRELLQLRVIFFLISVALLSLLGGLEVGRYIFSGKFEISLMEVVVLLALFSTNLLFVVDLFHGVLIEKRVAVKK